MKRALVLVMLTGCDSGHDPSTEPGSATLVSIIAGGSQRAVVGEELPDAIVVRATNANSEPVPDQLINFVVVTGGGSVFAGSALTNRLGEARERWTLGPTAGEQAIEARAIDQTSGDPIVFARVTATADPGPAMTMELSEIEHEMRIGDRLDVAGLTTVLDQNGNVIGEAPISVSAAPPFEIEGTTVASGVEHQGPITIQSGLASAILTLTVLRDLSALVGATGSYGCHGLMVRQNGPEDTDPRGVVTDYRGTFVVDSVLYPGAGGTTAALWITKESV
jgi:hypothetical protein